MIAEAVDSESVRDKIHKFSVALKEARETEYWLELIETAELLQCDEHKRSSGLVSEVIAMLVSSLKTLRSIDHNDT